MFAKSRRNLLELSYNDWIPSVNSPHVVYANLEFAGDAAPKGSRRLLRYVEGSIPWSWTEERTLRYLKQHQAEFRNCLDWLSKDSFVDFGPYDVSDDEREFRERWDREPEVQFLQQHGLDHGGVTFAPRTSDPMHPFSGLELHQKKARDPLDPICWYIITLLATYGTVFVRRCRYHKCGKFFWRPTERRLFCSDSCRAFQHVVNVCFNADDDFLEDHFLDNGPTARDKFLKQRAEYMKKYRANPRRRIIEYQRTPKTEP